MQRMLDTWKKHKIQILTVKCEIQIIEWRHAYLLKKEY